MNTVQKLTIQSSVSAILILALIIFTILFFFYRGIPLHDWNLRKLQKQFDAIMAVNGVPKSALVMKKSYLGGPYTHGSLSCSYVVGEFRSSHKTKEEILRTYQNLTIASVGGDSRRIPINVLFVDDDNWAMTLPLVDWEDEIKSLHEKASSTVYLVYAAQEGYPFFGDLRCDD